MTTDEAVEAIRVASFEALGVKAGSQWARRIEAVLTEFKGDPRPGEVEYDRVMGLLMQVPVPCLDPGGRFGEDRCERCAGCRLRNTKRVWKVARGG